MPLNDDEVPFNLDIEMHRFCDQEVAILDNAIVRGAACDFAHYKELCGQRAGLLRMQQHFIELIEKWNNRG